jgi:hypothetical protein
VSFFHSLDQELRDWSIHRELRELPRIEGAFHQLVLGRGSWRCFAGRSVASQLSHRFLVQLEIGRL